MLADINLSTWRDNKSSSRVKEQTIKGLKIPKIAGESQDPSSPT